MAAMNTEEYNQLQTVQDRANYLLSIGVTAKTDIVDLDVVSRACVGGISLPVTAATDELAIKRGTEWLQNKAR